jgi:integrase
MKLESYPNEDGYSISLTKTERKKILNHIDDENLRRAWIINSYSGARIGESVDVKYKDINKRDSEDYFIRIYGQTTKNNEYRSTPLPEKFGIEFKTILRSNPDIRPNDEIISCTKRTLNRKLNKLKSRIEIQNIENLTFHDARRTFINCLLDDNISPLQVMMWTGHKDWQTFRDHYLKDFSEKHQSEELAKTEIY